MNKLTCLGPLLAFAAIGAAEPSPPDFIIPGDLCGVLASSTAQPLAGKWLAVNRDGGGMVGSGSVMLKDRPKQKLEIEHRGEGRLRMTGISAQGFEEMELEPQQVGESLPDEFNFEIEGDIVTIEVTELLPCTWEEMPSYVGDVSYDLAGTGTLNMRVLLNFSSRTTGFGLLHFTGNMMGREIAVLRYITLTRDDPEGDGKRVGTR